MAKKGVVVAEWLKGNIRVALNLDGKLVFKYTNLVGDGWHLHTGQAAEDVKNAKKALHNGSLLYGKFEAADNCLVGQGYILDFKEAPATFVRLENARKDANRFKHARRF